MLKNTFYKHSIYIKKDSEKELKENWKKVKNNGNVNVIFKYNPISLDTFLSIKTDIKPSNETLETNKDINA